MSKIVKKKAATVQEPVVEEDDPDIRAIMEAESREEASRKEREAADETNAGITKTLRAIGKGRQAANQETLHANVIVLRASERDGAAESTYVTMLVPASIPKMGGRPTYVTKAGVKDCYTVAEPDALGLKTFVTENNLKKGAVPTVVYLYPRAATNIGIPDAPGLFPFGVPLKLFDIRASSYIKKKKGPAADAAGTAADVVTYGPGAPVVPAEKPEQGNSLASPSGLQNIAFNDKSLLQTLTFEEAVIAWAPLLSNTVMFTPTDVPTQDRKNIVLIPTGSRIGKIVHDLTGLSVLPVHRQEFQGADDGKGVNFDTSVLSADLDPTHKLLQSAYGRLFQVQNNADHLKSLAAHAEDPSAPVAPIGMSVAVAGYGEFLTYYGIDHYNTNLSRWIQGVLTYLPRAEGFLVCRINWERTAESGRNLRDTSAVKVFDPTSFASEAETRPDDSFEDPVAMSKFFQPMKVSALMPVQDWRGMILKYGIRVHPQGAHMLFGRVGSDQPPNLVVGKRPALSSKRLGAMFLGQGVVPMYVYMTRGDHISRAMPVSSERTTKVGGKERTVTVWKAPENEAYTYEYYVLSPTLGKMPNPLPLVEKVNHAKPMDSGVRFLDALAAGNSITGDESIYDTNPDVREAIKSLREQSIVSIDTPQNVLLFAVIMDAPTAKTRQFPKERVVRPEVLAIMDTITGPLSLSEAMRKEMLANPDAALLNSHGSNLGTRLSSHGKVPRAAASAAPAAKKAKRAAEPEPEPEPEPEADLEVEEAGDDEDQTLENGEDEDGMPVEADEEDGPADGTLVEGDEELGDEDPVDDE